MTKAVQDLMTEVERVRDAFHTALYDAADPDAVAAASAGTCTLSHLPVGTGAIGLGALRDWVARDVVGHLPPDLTFTRVTRTGDRWRVVDEVLVTFTHDRELPWLLPGVPATGRAVEVRAVDIVSVRRSLVTEVRTLWDHATLLDTLGLDLAAAPSRASTAPA